MTTCGTVEQTRTIEIGSGAPDMSAGTPATANQFGIWPESWRDGSVHLSKQVLRTQQVRWPTVLFCLCVRAHG